MMKKTKDSIAIWVMLGSLVVFLVIFLVSLRTSIDSRPMDTSTMMLSWVIALVLLAIPGVITVMIIRRRERRMRQILDEDQTAPAFEGEIDSRKLLADPSELEPLRGKVSRVVLIRNIIATGGTSAGSNIRSTFLAFVIDTNGRTHDLIERREHHQAEKVGRWLADQLGVPFEDNSYG